MSTPVTPQEVFATELSTAQAAAEQSDQERAAAVDAAAEAATEQRTQGRTFTEVEVAAIRKQEKDKLYKQLEERDARLAALEADLAKRQQAEREEQERLEAERQARAEAERKAKEEQMTFEERLAETERKLQEQLEAERAERLALVAQQEKEREFLALNEYRNQAIQAAQEDIVPELLDMVSGNTPEEIDSSIASLKERSQRIFESVAAARQEQLRQQPGTRVTSPGVGPMEINTENKQLSAQDIQGMSMNEYAQIRQKLIGQSPTNRGMFR